MVGERASQLDRCLGALKDRDRLGEQRQTAFTALDQAFAAERDT